MKEYFYQVNVALPKNGYSFGICIQWVKKPEDKEVLFISELENKFEDDDDINVAEVVPMTKDEYYSVY